MKTTVSKGMFQSQLDAQRLPKHVAIIMDGNGRWAKGRGLPRVMGHREGIKSVRSVVEAAREVGVEVLTLYAFSVENWKRSSSEVSTLMRLLNEYLRRELANMMKNQIRLGVLGDFTGLPKRVQTELTSVMKKTEKNRKMLLNLALNYGGRSEILHAVNQIAAQVRSGEIPNGQFDEKRFSKFLYTSGLPDPDLLIRTSGEKRISNFLLWQISYSELYLTDTLWPDFGKVDFLKALLDFQRRERRFGA